MIPISLNGSLILPRESGSVLPDNPTSSIGSGDGIGVRRLRNPTSELRPAHRVRA